jgi:hypothetical protein
MDAETAARRWADPWSRARPQRDIEAIAALYAGTAVYRSPAFRQPYSGLAGVRRSGGNGRVSTRQATRHFTIEVIVSL